MLFIATRWRLEPMTREIRRVVLELFMHYKCWCVARCESAMSEQTCVACDTTFAATTPATACRICETAFCDPCFSAFTHCVHCHTPICEPCLLTTQCVNGCGPWCLDCVDGSIACWVCREVWCCRCVAIPPSGSCRHFRTNMIKCDWVGCVQFACVRCFPDNGQCGTCT